MSESSDRAKKNLERMIKLDKMYTSPDPCPVPDKLTPYLQSILCEIKEYTDFVSKNTPKWHTEYRKVQDK